MDKKSLVAVILVLATVIGAFQLNRHNGLRDKRIMFKVYWNVPTSQCAKYELGFEELMKKYNILQNVGDQFRGDQIALLYDPGLFPEISSSPSGFGNHLRNGGVPQEGNLSLHLEIFEQNITKQIPDINFAGVGIIDMESWRAVYRQNFGSLQPYKDLSIKLEKEKHPFWTNNQIQNEARSRFEKYGKLFMEEALLLAKRLRPKATWGYYAYPYCFNNDMQRECASTISAENDGITWLFKASDNIYPSVYLRKGNFTPAQRINLILGRVEEAQRIQRKINDKKERYIIPYYTLVHPDTDTFLAEEDIVNSISTLKTLQVDAVIIWGASKHVNTKKKCEDLYTYVDTIFGPALIR